MVGALVDPGAAVVVVERTVVVVAPDRTVVVVAPPGRTVVDVGRTVVDVGRTVVEVVFFVPLTVVVGAPVTDPSESSSNSVAKHSPG